MSFIFNKKKNFHVSKFHNLSFENDDNNSPGKSILLKFSQIVAKMVKKQRVTKFGSHSLSGFRVAPNTFAVWDKNPPPP